MRMNRTQRQTRKSVPRKPSQTVRLPRDYAWKVATRVTDALQAHIDPKLYSSLTTALSSRSLDEYLSLGREWGLQSITPATQLTDPGDPACHVMLSSLIKKFCFDGDIKARKRAAIETFLDGEDRCKRYNQKGRKILRDDPVFYSAKLFIKRVIGEELPEEEALFGKARHGPGTCTGTSFGLTTAYDKYASLPYDVTQNCVIHGRKLILSDARWCRAISNTLREQGVPLTGSAFPFDHVFNVVKGNKITSVPKDALKERPIAIEPTINMMLQLGVDGFIRKRLKRWGINLDDQSKNRKLAYEGSLRMDVLSPATIDLSAASDSISLGIAKFLLPEPWFRYVCDLRSPSGEVDGSQIRYSKLSTMGNGYTFAVESLIFASIVYGVCKVCLGYYPRDTCSVFGDDIIVPEGCGQTVAEYLELAGFSLNKEKSFLSGSVKESCGSDWYRGLPMRGVFLKEFPSTVAELMSDRNRLQRWFFINHYEREWASVDRMFHLWLPNWSHKVRGPLSSEEFDTYLHDRCLNWRRSKEGYYSSPVLTSRYAGNRSSKFAEMHWLVQQHRGLIKELPFMLDVRLTNTTQGSVYTLYDKRRIIRSLDRRRQWWRKPPDCYCSPAEEL